MLGRHKEAERIQEFYNEQLREHLTELIRDGECDSAQAESLRQKLAIDEQHEAAPQSGAQSYGA